MLDYTQSFQEFSQSLKPIDLALYAGAAIIIWVLFKNKFTPIQKSIIDFVNNFKIKNPVTFDAKTTKETKREEDLFFKLVSSWKQTRDLAFQSGCEEAVKVADQMFPYLSPQACVEKNHEQ